MEKTNNQQERRGGNRNIFILAGFVAFAILVMAAVVISVKNSQNCGENEEFKNGQCVVKREVDVYTFKHDYPDKGRQTATLTVKVPKSLGYVAKQNDTKIELYRESDRSTVSFYIMLTSKDGIAMKEEDYSKSAWKDYKRTENEDGSVTVEINKMRANGSIYGVEWSKAIREEFGKYWSGVRMTAMASGLDQGEDSSFGGKDYKTFKARDTYENADFQYMLDSIELSVSSMETVE